MGSLPTAVRTKVQELKARIAEELRATQMDERDRAHQATCGDRPFVGCNPCEPADTGSPEDVQVNPAAKAKR